MSVDQII